MGGMVKSPRRPYKPDWQAALTVARAAPRCRARCRRSPAERPQCAVVPSAVCTGVKAVDRAASPTVPIEPGAIPLRQRPSGGLFRTLLIELRRLMDAQD